MEMERCGAFGSAALMSFDAGGKKETRRARAASASTFKSFTRNRLHCAATTDVKMYCRLSEFSLGHMICVVFI